MSECIQAYSAKTVVKNSIIQLEMKVERKSVKQNTNICNMTFNDAFAVTFWTVWTNFPLRMVKWSKTMVLWQTELACSSTFHISLENFSSLKAFVV